MRPEQGGARVQGGQVRRFKKALDAHISSLCFLTRGRRTCSNGRSPGTSDTQGVANGEDGFELDLRDVYLRFRPSAPAHGAWTGVCRAVTSKATAWGPLVVDPAGDGGAPL